VAQTTSTKIVLSQAFTQYLVAFRVKLDAIALKPTLEQLRSAGDNQPAWKGSMSVSRRSFPRFGSIEIQQMIPAISLMSTASTNKTKSGRKGAGSPLYFPVHDPRRFLGQTPILYERRGLQGKQNQTASRVIAAEHVSNPNHREARSRRPGVQPLV
jgi:hypothetical protein